MDLLAFVTSPAGKKLTRLMWGSVRERYAALLLNVGVSADMLDRLDLEGSAAHVALSVDDVDRIYADWSAKGIQCNCSPQISPDGKAKLFFCQDPDGTFLEIVQPLKNS